MKSTITQSKATETLLTTISELRNSWKALIYKSVNWNLIREALIWKSVNWNFSTVAA